MNYCMYMAGMSVAILVILLLESIEERRRKVNG